MPPVSSRTCILVLVVLAGCGEPTSSEVGGPIAGTPTPAALGNATASNGKIAFTSARDGDPEIFVMDADGSDVVQLTHNTTTDREPAWSPDGTRLAFTSARDGNGEVYVMNADGTEQVNVTNSPLGEDSPSWSPDGARIAYSGQVPQFTHDIWLMDADGSNRINLTNDQAPDDEPSWSPDGTRIAFTTDRDASALEVYVINIDGTGLTRLTTSEVASAFPSWSPDGTRIAYAGTSSDQFAIFVMNADGSEPQNLTGFLFSEFHSEDSPAWSPDGASILYRGKLEGSPYGIFAVNPDGTDPRPLTGSVFSDGDPAWQPVPAAPVYQFTGFFPPIDNAPVVNGATAGRSIPVKFSLGGDQGIAIFLPGYPKFVTEPCNAEDPEDAVETTATGPSGITYDAGLDQYVYVWRSSRSLAGRCGRLLLGLADESDHSALFHFRP